LSEAAKAEIIVKRLVQEHNNPIRMEVRWRPLLRNTLVEDLFAIFTLAVDTAEKNVVILII